MTTARQGAIYTNQYRNVFREFGYGEAHVAKRMQETWEQLFYGDEDTKIYYELDDDKAYILDTGNLDVRTEGLSYGMMMCVQMDRKSEFNKLWRFAKTFMQHQDGRYQDYFAWHTRPDGTRISQDRLRTAKNTSPWRCCSRPAASRPSSRTSIQATTASMRLTARHMMSLPFIRSACSRRTRWPHSQPTVSMRRRISSGSGIRRFAPDRGATTTIACTSSPCWR